MVVDGSVKNRRSAAGVIIKDNDGQFTRITILVDGSEKYLTLYRDELSSMYCGYLHLERLIGPPDSAHLHRTIWSNIKPSLLKIHHMSNVKPVLIKQSLQPEFSLVSAVNCIRRKFYKISITTIHLCSGGSTMFTTK